MDTFGPFSANNLDADSLKQVFINVNAAIDRQDYTQILDFTSQALVQIHESLVTMLTYRAYVLSMHGKFDEAIKDAQNIIGYVPTLAIGYLQLARIYRMQGKQRSAIDAYNLGLQSVSPDHPDYTQMIHGKELATKQNEAKVDFIGMLPVEVVNDILALLPPKSMFNWMSVSDVWRSRITRCPSIWKTWKTHNSTNIDWSTDTIGDIAANVEDLTIDTSIRHVFLHYLNVLKDGRFTKLKTLYLNANATKHITSDTITPFSGAFWGIHDTLTKLVIEFSYDGAVIAPPDLLSFCPNLRCLEYSATSEMSHLIGDLPPLYPHDNLIDLRLTAKSINGQDIRKLLSSCQQLRRLLLHGCDSTVLDIVDKICPNLETFGYNAHADMVPELGDLCTPGLRRLYTQNGGVPVPASAILPLIRRNQLSLESLYVNISGKNSPKDLIAIYADMELKNLNRLTFWGDDVHIIQPLLLRSISTCNALTQFTAVGSGDIAGITQTLILLPQLEHLSISYARTGAGGEYLAQLFTKYAKDPQSERRLKSITLRYCQTITDGVLAALADINTLESVTFEGASRVSTKGWSEFFKKMSSSISNLSLKEIDTITTGSLMTIGSHLNYLKSIRLEKLDSVSAYGFTEMISNVSKLQSLTLVKCNVDQKARELATRNVKNVVII